MPKPTEHKSVQLRILKYAQDIGWTLITREEAQLKRGFNSEYGEIKEKAKTASIFFDDTLFEKVKEFNPKFSDSKENLIKKIRLLSNNIFGNRDFIKYLREEQKFYYKEENRELDLKIIDYDKPENNVFEVTEEFYFHNGKYGDREDVVFLINGIPLMVIECKNSTKDEAIALGVDQIRRYHTEIPELFVPQQIFTVTESIGFSYGVTWNTIRRNIFNWKDNEIGNLEAKIKTFCSKENILAYIKDYIVFAEQNEELNKYILRQHQKEAIEKVVERAHDPEKNKGLVWHTQGSGKTFTMIKSAELLFKAPESDKPTILLMIDRNELEDQIMKNLDSVGLNNTVKADSIKDLEKLLKNDYRGIIVTMIHKFRGIPENLNMRKNIYVLIDEAHRTTQGDLGTFLMSAVPNASFIGFTGTPIDKTYYGKGTFKTFGVDDDKGYLHKYSISDSIKDGTTLPLYYSIASNDLLVPKEILEEEFLKNADNYGVTDIDELNKTLERAVNTKNFLKGKKRIPKVAEFVAKHYKETIEPLGYKAFLVGVDREACALYKNALDKFLPSEYSKVVYTGNNNDSEILKAFHIDEKKERQIRKSFTKSEELPKILIVTEKLLTGYDAPLLYAMYLDKPMKDHTLLQAIARVNRPYENEDKKMVKPHGFVLDFVGIFENLEKALAFDSDEVNSIIKDIKILKALFKQKMEGETPKYLDLIKYNFNDKDTDNLIEYFRDKEKRKEFFKLFKDIEMLYEIISPDPFLRPYIDKYSTIASIYSIVNKSYTKRVYVDREFLKKTNELIQNNIDSTDIRYTNDIFEIDEKTIYKIKESQESYNTKVINLIKLTEKNQEESNDPFLISIQERAEKIKERWESRQQSTQETLDELIFLVEQDEKRKKEQAEKGFDGLTFFVYKTLIEKSINNPEGITNKIKEAFIEFPNWLSSTTELRELRRKVTFAIFSEEDDENKVVPLVDELINFIERAYNE